MGCDIHFYVEKRKAGGWELVHPPEITICEDECEDGLPEDLPDGVKVYADWEAQKAAHGGDYWDKLFKSDLYVGRNYNLFSILADVRNGVGFAGVDTGDKFSPIDQPRGIPEDASDLFRYEAGSWGVDGHSHSHFTVQELLDYDWEQTTTNRGIVGPDEFEDFQKDGKPKSWVGGVSGGRVEHISNEEMAAYVGIPKRELDRLADTPAGMPFKPAEKAYYTKVSWEETYRSCAEHFLETTLPALQALGDPDEVRICFFFDN